MYDDEIHVGFSTTSAKGIMEQRLLTVLEACLTTSRAVIAIYTLYPWAEYLAFTLAGEVLENR